MESQFLGVEKQGDLTYEPIILLNVFNLMEKKRELMIKSLQQQIETYEKKRAQQQAAYHRMSAFRKLLAGKTPEHHLAVEYLVYVKQPMEEIEKINREISLIKWMAEKLRETTGQDIQMLPQFKGEILQLYGKEEVGS